MEELFAIKDFYKLYEGNQFLVMLCIMIVAFYPLLIIMKKMVLPAINKVVDKKSQNYSNTLERHNLSGHIVQVFAALYLMFWGDIFSKSSLISDVVTRAKDIVITIYIVITITSLLLALVNIGVDLYKDKAVTKRIAIELHTHILKMFIVICAILAIFSLVIGISISSLFTSIGAAAALLTFVFKDTVLGLLASLQLTFQDIIRVGDWVTLPQYNADGDIQKITISVVVIRNFDNTYTTVPTSAFLVTGVKNWRPMFEIGGRRIKRAISLDMDTVKICDQKSLNIFKKMPCMVEFARQNTKLFDAKSGKTNISMFRYYIDQYLKSNQNIHQEGFTFLVRELDPTPTGIPIELYVFTKDTKWANYEAIQADIFDHLLGIVPCFGLKVFQTVAEA